MSGVTTFIRDTYRLAYEISPIVLRNGIANYIPGGFLPIVALTEIESAAINLLNGNFTLTNLDDYFAHWEPSTGTQIESWQVGQYPFANQTTAANAVIQQPLAISMIMKCPVKGKGGYAARLATMTALKFALDKHITSGGWFDIATPTWIYTGCLLLNASDITSGGTEQKQIQWRFDFTQPLITNAQAIQVANNTMKKVASGLPL